MELLALPAPPPPWLVSCSSPVRLRSFSFLERAFFGVKHFERVLETAWALALAPFCWIARVVPSRRTPINSVDLLLLRVGVETDSFAAFLGDDEIPYWHRCVSGDLYSLFHPCPAPFIIRCAL